jgi:hypothetical protein
MPVYVFIVGRYIIDCETKQRALAFQFKKARLAMNPDETIYTAVNC